MGCARPIDAWQRTGEAVQFKPGPPLKLKLPCGKCAQCYLEKARQWAVRAMHETQMHAESCFATLTVEDDDKITLEEKDYTNFVKRLRHKRFNTISYLMCGEYGDEKGRPHYHALIWGYRPLDAKPTSTLGNSPYSTSSELDKLWGHGGTSIGEITFESASYVARYTMKKLDKNSHRCMYVDSSTGQTWELYPEYSHMSRQIGISWLQKYLTDVYPKDEVISRGTKARPPRRYDKYLEETQKETYEAIKRRRQATARNNWRHSTPRARTAKEATARAKLQLNKRGSM